MRVFRMGALALGAILALGWGTANAAVLGPFTDLGPGGNACPAGGLTDCVLNIDLNGDGVADPTPAIIKFGVSHIKSAANDSEAISGNFPSVTGLEFLFSNFTYKGADLVKFDFAYTLGASDPAITAVAVKGSTKSTVSTDFTFANGVFSGTLYGVGCSSSLLTGPNCKGVSNVVFFDTGVPNGVVPLPASALLLLGGIGGLGALRSTRRKA